MSTIAERKKILETKVTVKVVSSAGHDEYEETADVALTRIQDLAKNQNKWVYIDLNRRDANSLTVDDLIDAEDIMLTNALIGG